MGDHPEDWKRCFLCLGRIHKKNEITVECEWCGRVYHKACAKRVGRCPQCGDELPMEKEPAPDAHLDAEMESRLMGE